MKTNATHLIHKLFFFFVGTMLLMNSAMAGSPVVNPEGDAAVQGYDVMAYWNKGEPEKGNPEISFEYDGASWHFVSVENRDKFAAEPEKYAPQYGGYCAYAAAKGSVVSIDVNAWSIHDDKLYLNYNRAVSAIWSLDKAGYIVKADANWPKILEN